MECTLTKKCAFCGEVITISKSNTKMIAFKNKNYHMDCFISMCNKRIKKNNQYSSVYEEALRNLDVIKKETELKLLRRIIQDELNIYLLSNYDVGALSGRFWEMINNIQDGIYKGRRCNPVDIQTLLDMWKAYQSELNQTNLWNSQHGKNIDGEERVKYDLAILMTNYGKYKKKKAKEDASAKAAQIQKDNIGKINYESLSIKSNRQTESNDILDMMDDIF